MSETKYCLVQFKYQTKLEQNEDVRITGQPPELGSWDFNKAEKLTFSNEDYPIWKTRDNIKIPQNSTVEYKYVIFKDNQFSRWEDLPYNVNRKFSIVNNIRLVVLDKQDDSNTQIEKSDFVESDSTANLRRKSTEDERDFLHSANVNDLRENIQFEEKKSFGDEFRNLDYESDKEENDNINNKQQTQTIVDINDDDDIIMVSFLLPVNVKKKEDGEWDFVITNDPLYHTIYRLIMNKKNIKWFSIIKNQDKYSEEELKQIKEKLIKEKNIYIIDISSDIYNKIIILFQEILEPLFHYISLSPKIIEEFSHFDKYWNAYKKFSECVCDTILSHLKENSLIIFHDYHFFLTPNYLYQRCQFKNNLKSLSIGLFMHSPFPSCEIFKKIPFREEILKSLIYCSVIGFHSFDYSRNFLKSAKRLLNINYESTISGDLAVNYHERYAMIRVKNVTPEIDLIKEYIDDDLFKSTYKSIKDKYPNKCIFISIDNVAYLSSIKNKLEGYKIFLSDFADNEENLNKNVYLIYLRFATEDYDENGQLILNDTQKELINKIDELTKDIKEKYGEDRVEFIKGKLGYNQRLGVFAAANCYVRTSKQESFSLGLYEFLILKKLLKSDDRVSYMVSELSGVNTSLGLTIKINPFDYSSIYKGFMNANEQIYGEKDERDKLAIEKDFNHVMKSSCKEWLYSFLKDIKNTKLSDDNIFYLGVGERFNFKLSKITKGFQKLDVQKILPDYQNSKRRLIFFDYEGTLPSMVSFDNALESKGNRPSEEILNRLSELCEDKKNKVFIITGRGINLVSEWFGSVKDLGLAAEYGFLNKINTKNTQWRRLAKEYNNEWIENVIDLLQSYTERCEGSTLEVKELSVVWKYNDCDQELGKSFAVVITSELEYYVKKLNLRVINGKGYVEVIALGINKGTFVSYIIKENLFNALIPDFIMCVGDDTSDEKMFYYLKEKEKELKVYNKNIKLLSITVGKKPSNAMYYVDNSKDIQSLIEDFIKVGHNVGGSLSNYDIKSEANKKEMNLEENEKDIKKNNEA